MKNATLTWDLPTVRESGEALSANDLDYARVQMSADQGSNWADVNTVDASDPQQLTINDLDIGTWMFRVRAVDTDGREGPWNEISGEVIDDTPPGAVTNLNVTFS